MKRWRDWVANDFWPRYRLGPQSQNLHYSFEQAGLTIPHQPIPWNSEAVLVGAIFRLPRAARRKSDFSLRLAGRAAMPAESLRRDDGEDVYHLQFRFPPPPATTTATLLWRGHPLGQIHLPVLDALTFVGGLQLQLPTLSVRLGRQHVACQTFVASQCRGLVATAVLTSATCLAPITELGVSVQFRCEGTGETIDVPAPLCSSQLAARQAIVVAVLPRVVRRAGEWSATWRIADQTLATQRVRGISRAAFQGSLRVVDTRFLVETEKGSVNLCRHTPGLTEAQRVGPAFFVASREPGMAGLIKLQARAHSPGTTNCVSLPEQTVLVTDGPTLFAPGTINTSELGQVTTFELRSEQKTLGELSLCPTPTANFTPEGGFEPPTDFVWTASAEDELSERLGKLMDGPQN